MRLNCFSNSFCVNSMATGLPWGQYFTWPDMTAWATRSSSWSLVFQPPLMAALQAIPPRYDALTLALAFERREDMWSRIDRRVDQMMDQGLVAEVQGLLDSGVPAKCTAMQAIGYKERAAALLSGGDVRAAAEEIQLRSRQYAKRQLTWFKRNKAARWLLWGREPDFEAALQTSTEYMEEFGLV